jgi:predicted unusual protein kinase regulating ubiquinone biosynthesis (AarF/ABC1/UbiB family)
MKAFSRLLCAIPLLTFCFVLPRCQAFLLGRPLVTIQERTQTQTMPQPSTPLLVRMLPYQEQDPVRRPRRRRDLSFNPIRVPSDAFSFEQEQQRKYLRIHQSVRKRRSLHRLVEITSILFGQVIRPVICSLTIKRPNVVSNSSFDWDAFWTEDISSGINNAQRVVEGFQQLGPTYVKLGQALATRPDLLHNEPLANALATLHDNVRPFEDRTAKRMIKKDLFTDSKKANALLPDKASQKAFLDSLSARPIAAASIAQVYKGTLPGYGPVAVKVQRPGIRKKVERDATLFHSLATWLQSMNKWPHGTTLEGQPFFDSPQLVLVADEFTARVLEDMDFEREAANMQAFAKLYSHNTGLSTTVKVVVPELIPELCSRRVIVMEWIEGTKLTDICKDCDERAEHVAENLALVQTGIECTLSQFLDTGLLHADPHIANLLKVRTSGGPKLGYLDFGLVNSVPQNVRDGIVCAVIQLVFAYNVAAVADLCVDLELLPKERLEDPVERERLIKALKEAFDSILEWPRDKQGRSTAVPRVRFDNLLSSLASLAANFEFTIPPYGLNNARALVTMEGIARELDPSFNILRVVYPYCINRLMRNPAVSELVEDTFMEIIRSPETKLFDPHRFQTLLNDWALLTGYRKRKIFWDLTISAGTRRVALRFMREWYRTQICSKGHYGNGKRRRLLFAL